MISCADAVRQLWSYLEDEVSDADRRRIAEHVEACRRCCGEIEFFAALRQHLANSQLKLPAEAGARLESFLAGLEDSRG